MKKNTEKLKEPGEILRLLDALPRPNPWWATQPSPTESPQPKIGDEESSSSGAMIPDTPAQTDKG
jgi:hypothetical protein